MTQRMCQAPGCGGPIASSFAAYCRPHQARLRRHGAVDQTVVTKAQLKPYVAMVKARIAGTPDNQAWATLDSRWPALLDHARGLIGDGEGGPSDTGHELMAARELVKLAYTVEARDVLEVVGALLMMSIMDPLQFKSDAALWIQLARRVRGLADPDVVESWDHRRQRVRRRARELSPKAARCLGHWLATAFGAVGPGLAKAEQAERARLNHETRGRKSADPKLV